MALEESLNNLVSDPTSDPISAKDFASKANELLNYQYKKQDYLKSHAGKIETSLPDADPNLWKQIAEERLASLHEKSEILIQFRDEAQAWNEAYLKERDRGDRLEKLLLDKVIETRSAHEVVDEVRHVVSSPEQVNRKRANWPQIKAELEKKYSSLSDKNISEQDSMEKLGT